MSADNIWVNAVSTVLRDGESSESRNGSSMEAIAFQSHGSPFSPFVFNRTRNASPMYAAGELLWYMSGMDSGDIICHYAPSYSRFLNEGTAIGAYGPRIFGTHAIQDVLRELMNGESRRAVIPIHRLSDLRNTRPEHDCKDIPCTLSLQFFARAGYLHMITTMRSNDVWLGLPYDLFAFMMIQQMIAEATGLTLGFYYHQAGSMHIYEEHERHFVNWEGDMSIVDPLKIAWDPEAPTLARLRGIVKQEEIIRTQRWDNRQDQIAAVFGHHSIATTLLVLATLQNFDRVMTAEERLYLKQIIDERLVDAADATLKRRFHEA